MSDKTLHVTGNFTLNVLDYKSNDKVTKFFNITFEYNLVPVINKPTPFTRTSATAIDYVITNSLLYSNRDTGLIK